MADPFTGDLASRPFADVFPEVRFPLRALLVRALCDLAAPVSLGLQGKRGARRIPAGRWDMGHSMGTHGGPLGSERRVPGVRSALLVSSGRRSGVGERVLTRGVGGRARSDAVVAAGSAGMGFGGWPR